MGGIDNSGAITGTGSAVNVFSFTLNANTMQAGKALQLVAAVNHTGANSVVYNFNFGSCSMALSAGSGGNGAWIITVRNKSAVQNAQTVSDIGNIESIASRRLVRWIRR